MKKKLLFLFCLFIINLFLWQAVFQVSSPYFQLTFFDVGQGDSIFMRYPEIPHIFQVNNT